MIKAEAVSLGFLACGLAPAEAVRPEHAGFFQHWLAGGQQGNMEWMGNNVDKRLNPALLEEGCRTVVSVALNYRPQITLPPDKLQISWYAYGEDYHRVMKRKLNTLLESLKGKYADAGLEGRAFCDTAPVLERYWATQCGIGWIGKHTQIVIPHAGSAFFLGELILNLPADCYDAPITESRCGSCRKCLDACPAGALSADGGLDARRCLSYLTIENRDQIPEWAKEKMYPYFYGCDRCLRACPHLRDAKPSDEPALAPRHELTDATDEEWMELSPEEYQEWFRHSAVKRAKYEGLVRNIEAIREKKETGQ